MRTTTFDRTNRGAKGTLVLRRGYFAEVFPDRWWRRWRMTSRLLFFLTASFAMSEPTLDKTKLAEACRDHGVTYAGLFGSWARGEATGESDIDLLVRFRGRQSLVDLARIEREIREEIGVSVDLVTEQALSPHLRDRVLADLEVIVDDDE